MTNKKIWKKKPSEDVYKKYVYLKMILGAPTKEKLGEAGLAEVEARIKTEMKLVREKLGGWIKAAYES